MPPKRFAKRDKKPIERAIDTVHQALPDTQYDRKPFYVVYTAVGDGMWVFIFRDTIRDTINKAIIQNRETKIISFTQKDVDFKEGVNINEDLLKIFMVRRINPKKVIEQDIYRTKPPKICVSIYFGEDRLNRDFQMIQVDIPNPNEADNGLKSICRSFILWDTQMFLDFGYDPKKDEHTRCYFSEDLNKAPKKIVHMKEVKEFCLSQNLPL